MSMRSCIFCKRGDASLVVDTTPYGPQWASVLQKDTLIIDCQRNKMALVWVSNGAYRALITLFTVDTLLYREDEDDRQLVCIGSDRIVQVDLPPNELSFSVRSNDDSGRSTYKEPAYRALS